MIKNSPKNIGIFKLYNKRPNTISKGSLYIAEVAINTQNEDKIRKIRVYLPSCYDFDNDESRYDVLYMLDGKNCFDDYTSFVGEWHADEHLEEDIKKGKKPYIIVGIDAPKKDIDRMEEMLPYNFDTILGKKEKNLLKGYANMLADFIINDLSKIIDNTFFTNNAKRAIMGSSMGGLFSFYAAMKNPEFYCCCLSFSVPFFLYDYSHFKKKLTEAIKNPTSLPDVFLYCGGGDAFEYLFEKGDYFAYKHLFKKTRTQYIFDSKQIHNEKAWDNYYDHAIRFWFKD